MPLTYATYQEALATLTAIPETDDNFQSILPNAIDYAEQRIYRELDMITENMRDASTSTIASNRNFALPTSLGTFQVVTGINIITPASTGADSGTRNPCTPVSLDVLDWTYPSASSAGVPTMFNYFSQASGQTGVVFGPWPDATYRVEVIGKIIPEPLSASNSTTFLTTYLPDLFLMASQIYFDNYMKNFGAISDDPKSAQTHEAQYQALLRSASEWEARKRFAGASWTSRQVEPGAVPQRG
jgi:hypothetical protein